MSEEIEVQIKIAQGRKSFSILEATMLWCEMDIHSERIEKWIRALYESKRAQVDPCFLYSPYLPAKLFTRLQKLSQELEMQRMMCELEDFQPEPSPPEADITLLQRRAKEIIEDFRKSKAFVTHCEMRDQVLSLARNMNDICKDGGDGPDLKRQIGKKQLKELAKVRKESPRFLFPNGAKEMGEEDIHPKTRTVWLNLIAALCLESGNDPRKPGMLEAITNITERQGLNVARSTIANILSEIKDTIDFPNLPA